jgi:ppGpp synthetase/RelA/SpoT-type nucleotidyltranferase
MTSGLPEISPLPSKETVNKAGRKLAEWLYDSAVVVPEEEIETLALHVYAWRAQHYGPLGLVMPMLREWSDRYSTSNIKPSQRLKRFKQILDKLYRHPEMKLARMQDIGGARAVLANRDEVEKLHAKIRDNWGISRVKDWRDEGRPDTGYRALHLMVAKRDQLSGENRIVEIQLRTEAEHRWSQVIMAAGEQLGYSLRDGDGPADLLDYFKLASEVLALIDQGVPAEKDLRERFAAAREQVRPYFTPKETS